MINLINIWHKLTVSVNTIQDCKCVFYSCNFLNNIFFSLAHFTVRISYVIHITYKISVNSSPVRLQVNCWLLVVKFLRESKVICWVFPGGSEVKNPLANPGDTGSVPDQGGSHMPQSNRAHAPQQLSVYFRAWEPQLLSAGILGLSFATKEATTMRSIHITTRK